MRLLVFRCDLSSARHVGLARQQKKMEAFFHGDFNFWKLLRTREQKCEDKAMVQTIYFS